MEHILLYMNHDMSTVIIRSKDRQIIRYIAPKKLFEKQDSLINSKYNKNIDIGRKFERDTIFVFSNSLCLHNKTSHGYKRGNASYLARILCFSVSLTRANGVKLH